jgi:hypothetical protein
VDALCVALGDGGEPPLLAVLSSVLEGPRWSSTLCLSFLPAAPAPGAWSWPLAGAQVISLAEGGAAHAGQRLGQADGRLAVEHDGALGDILGQVADALQLGGGLDRRQGLAQIHRHGLAQRQQLQGAVFDLLLHGVDAGITANRAFRRGAVPAGDGLNGGGKLGFRQSAHLGDQRGQGFQLFPEGLDGMVIHRAVSVWCDVRLSGSRHSYATVL